MSWRALSSSFNTTAITQPCPAPPPPPPPPLCHSTFSSSPRFLYRILASSSSSSQAAENNQKTIEVRVCTNRTCRRQGSLDILQVLTGISPPYVTVRSCGCLGRCGAGPNLVVLPDAKLIGHCGTPARAVETMGFFCGVDVDESEKSLEALALRKRAEVHMGSAEFQEADVLLTKAIDLRPFGGTHMMYKDRAAVRLAIGNVHEALEDAREALNLAPKYPDAYICQGDVLMAMDQFEEAEESYSVALHLDPSIRRSKSFKARIAKLQEKLAPVTSD